MVLSESDQFQESVRPQENEEIDGMSDEEENGAIVETQQKETDKDDEEFEGQAIKRVRKPSEPTQAEIDEHLASGHVPFRDWCGLCVMGSAQSNPHRKGEKEEQAIPVVSIDYAYMEDKSEDRGMPILVMKDRKSKSIAANVVPEKGVNQYAIKRLAKDIQLLGYQKIILKSDNENAILALKRAVIQERPCEIIPEESPVSESQSNGEIEATNKVIQGKTRTLRLGIESRYEIKMGREHMVVPWMIKHAAEMVKRLSVGKDGKTAWQRLKGKKFKGELLEFAECVWYLKPGTKGKEKFAPRWENGVWLGVREESGEAIVGTSEGVIKVRSVRRKGIAAERWNREQFEAIVGTPWQPIPGRESDEIRPRVNLPEAPKERVPIPKAIDSEPICRRVRINRDMVIKHGMTENCEGCKAVNRGGVARNHSEECRARMEEIMRNAGNSRLEKAETRVNEQLASRVKRLIEDQEDDKTGKRIKEGDADNQQSQSSGFTEKQREESKMENEPSKRQREEDNAMEEEDDRPTKYQQVEEEKEVNLVEKMSQVVANVEQASWLVGNEAEYECRKINGVWKGDEDKAMRELRKYGRDVQFHVTEVYSPPRVTAMAKRMNMVPGMALDMTTMDDDGLPWDFNNPDKVEKAKWIIKNKRAMLVIGSPMCAAFSQLQRINFSKMSEADRNTVVEYGKRHLEVCLELYAIQMNQGLYFLHEHPWNAASWQHEGIQQMLNRRGVTKVRGDMCSFGMAQLKR